jgi:radical SAM superfamily enzyme YgiQ (UPF0313 family)
MKILVVYPRWTGSYGLISGYFARKSGGVIPPLNLALIAAIARQGGHDVSIIDAEILRIDEDDLVNMVVEKQPDIVAMTGTSPFFHTVKSFAESLKKVDSSIKTLIGGQHITIDGDKAFFDCFDYGYNGECEDQLLSFFDAAEKGKGIEKVKGVFYRHNNKIHYTGPNVYQRRLDELPFPARDLLPYDKYKIGTLHGRKNFTSIQSMRGCPWHCIFCASDKLNTTAVSKRSPESIIEEMKQVIDNFGVRHFFVVDDVLTLYFDQHQKIICEYIIQEKMNVTFEGSTRSNLIDEKNVALMAEAGLIRLSFGLETVDSEMRKTMRKQVPLKWYSQANKILNTYNVEASNSVMIGLPGETRTTIKKTLDFLENDPYVKQANFAIAVPYPGTEFHTIAAEGKQGMQLLTDDFSEYRRYGTSVTNVGDLSSTDLVELQNEGFVSVYSKSHRWAHVIKKNGWFGGFLMLMRVLRIILQKNLKMIKKVKFTSTQTRPKEFV